MTINVNHLLLDKRESLHVAKTICFLGLQMDTRECAQEIYAHAWAYYHIPIRWIRRHADPVDLKDGGDTRFRKLIYRMIWALT